MDLNEVVRRRITANSLVIADGLEALQKDILALFSSELTKFQSGMLQRDDEHLAMLTSVVQELQKLRSSITSLESGLMGLSIQLSEHEVVYHPKPSPESSQEVI